MESISIWQTQQINEWTSLATLHREKTATQFKPITLEGTVPRHWTPEELKRTKHKANIQQHLRWNGESGHGLHSFAVLVQIGQSQAGFNSSDGSIDLDFGPVDVQVNQSHRPDIVRMPRVGFECTTVSEVGGVGRVPAPAAPWETFAQDLVTHSAECHLLEHRIEAGSQRLFRSTVPSQSSWKFFLLPTEMVLKTEN